MKVVTELLWDERVHPEEPDPYKAAPLHSEAIGWHHRCDGWVLGQVMELDDGNRKCTSCDMTGTASEVITHEDIKAARPVAIEHAAWLVQWEDTMALRTKIDKLCYDPRWWNSMPTGMPVAADFATAGFETQPEAAAFAASVDGRYFSAAARGKWMLQPLGINLACDWSKAVAMLRRKVAEYPEMADKLFLLRGNDIVERPKHIPNTGIAPRWVPVECDEDDEDEETPEARAARAAHIAKRRAEIREQELARLEERRLELIRNPPVKLLADG